MRHKLTVICGNAATGKTTYGARLATGSGAVLLDIDTVSERLVQAGLTASGKDKNDRDSPAFKAAYRDSIHETLFAIAGENLSHLPCVIVAPFTKERRDPTFPASLEARLGCPVEIHFLWCSDPERHKRLIQRGNPRDAGKLVSWDTYAAAGEDPESRPPFPHVFVDTSSRST